MHHSLLYVEDVADTVGEVRYWLGHHDLGESSSSWKEEEKEEFCLRMGG